MANSPAHGIQQLDQGKQEEQLYFGDSGVRSGQGSWPHCSPIHDCSPAQVDGFPSDQGFAWSYVPGVGPLLHQGKGGVCIKNSESEQGNSTSIKDSVDSETNTFTILAIILNMILSFVTTKKLLAKVLCEHRKKKRKKKKNTTEDIVKAHNIVLEPSNAR